MWNGKRPILFGGDYNPDQWDDATIDEDMKLFEQAGINLLVLPVFAWAKLEPEEGKYDFEWLDNILNKIWEHGIHVFLATPTSAQPSWLSKKYSDVLPVDIAGRRRTHGMRVFFCVNSINYRRRARAIAKALAERYRDFPGLAGWHVANEYGTYCYCENCRKKFITWLKARYGSIEELNSRWHTSFWGRQVYDFDDVTLPTELNDDYRFCPAVQLDYMRFVTDSTIECYLNEAQVLKAATPHLPVFTNISGFIKKLNQFEMTPHMDFVGWDNYPAPGDDAAFPAFKHEIMRAARDGAPFLVAEQSPNQQNWQPYNKIKRPGEIRRIAYQGLAHGADSSLFFQMRQSVAGQEKFHGAFIAHSGFQTRIFREGCALGQEFKKLGSSFTGGRIRARAAIVFDWENWWALELTSGPTQDMDYLKQVFRYYKAFYTENIPVDIIKTTTELDNYDLVVMPLLYMMKPGFDEKIREFVKKGGTAAATYMSGRADENDRCVFGAYPGPLKDVFGVWVEETDALYPEETIEIIMTGKEGDCSERQHTGKFLCDLFHAQTAEVLAVYGKSFAGEKEQECFYTGMPALTVNKYGEGHAYYLGCEPDESFMRQWILKLCEETGVKRLFAFEGKLELTCRENENGQYVFVINHGNSKGRVWLNEEGESPAYYSLLQDKEVKGVFTISPGEVSVLFRGRD